MTIPRKPQGKPSTRAATTTLEQITTDTDTFMFREDGAYDKAHVRDLIDAIKRGDELDPLTVWQAPGSSTFCVLDGHHRYRAYRAAKWTSAIRVEVFDGDLREARLIAASANTKVVLSLTNAERQNTAWRLVCCRTDAGKFTYSIRETHKAAGVSAAQVSNMRTVAKQLDAKDCVLPDTWLKARMTANDNEDFEMTDEDREQRLQAQIADIDKAIGSKITEAGRRSPDALAYVLSRRLGAQSHSVASFCQSVGVEADVLDDFEDEEDADWPF